MPDADLRVLERTDRQRWLVERYRRGLFTRDDLVPGDRVVCVSYWNHLSAEDPRNGLAGVIVGLRPLKHDNDPATDHEACVRLDGRIYAFEDYDYDICCRVKPEGA